MGNGVGETAITWLDSDGKTHVWPSLDAWVAAWWAYYRASDATLLADLLGEGRDPDETDRPAQDYLEDLVMHGDARSVALIQALAEAAETDDDFGDLGAKDIEDLLCHLDYGARFIDEVERRAAQSPAFARTLTWMWVGGGIEPGLRRRLLALGAIDLTR